VRTKFPIGSLTKIFWVNPVSIFASQSGMMPRSVATLMSKSALWNDRKGTAVSDYSQHASLARFNQWYQ
jgi:hypothetical protein